MEYAPDLYAFITQYDVQTSTPPLTFQVEGEFHIKGRLFSATTTGGADIKFQKAGCGCETPHELRGARRPLLELLPQVQELLQPDTGQPLHSQEYPTPDDLTQEVLDLSSS